MQPYVAEVIFLVVGVVASTVCFMNGIVLGGIVGAIVALIAGALAINDFRVIYRDN